MMDWFDIVKEKVASDRHTTNDPREYLEDYPKPAKIKWHIKRALHFMQQRNYNRARDYRGWAEKMKNNPDPRFVLDMEGNIITDPVSSLGRVRKVGGSGNLPIPKPKKYAGGPKATQALHDRFSSGAFSLEDMQEMHGKAGYRKYLLDKLKESEGV